MRFSRQEYWSGLPFPPPEDLPNPGIKPASHMSPAFVGGFFTTSDTWKPRGMPKTKYLQVLSQWNLLAAPWEAVIFY